MLRQIRGFLLLGTIVSSLIAAAIGIHGAISYPDAPIRETAEGYRGKAGKVRTRAEYEAFRRWEHRMLIAFPVAFGFGFSFAFVDHRVRRKAS